MKPIKKTIYSKQKFSTEEKRAFKNNVKQLVNEINFDESSLREFDSSVFTLAVEIFGRKRTSELYDITRQAVYERLKKTRRGK